MTSTSLYSPTDWAHADLWGPPVLKRWGGADLGWVAAWLFVMSVAAAVPAYWYMTAHPTLNPETIMYSPLVLGGGMLSLWVVFLGYPAYVSRIKGARSWALDFGWTFKRRDILIGLGAGLILRGVDFASGFLASKVIDMTDGNNANWLMMPRALIWTIPFCIGAAVIAPALEELFFRGFILRTLQRLRRIPQTWATGVSVVGSSVLFGAMHTTALSPGGIYVAVFTGSIGAVLAFMSVRTGRLGPAVITHIVFNTTGTLAALLLR